MGDKLVPHSSHLFNQGAQTLASHHVSSESVVLCLGGAVIMHEVFIISWSVSGHRSETRLGQVERQRPHLHLSKDEAGQGYAEDLARNHPVWLSSPCIRLRLLVGSFMLFVRQIESTNGMQVVMLWGVFLLSSQYLIFDCSDLSSLRYDVLR